MTVALVIALVIALAWASGATFFAVATYRAAGIMAAMLTASLYARHPAGVPVSVKEGGA